MPPQKKKEEGKSTRKHKSKGSTQRPPMERVMVVGPTGKKRFAWRPWRESPFR